MCPIFHQHHTSKLQSNFWHEGVDYAAQKKRIKLTIVLTPSLELCPGSIELIQMAQFRFHKSFLLFWTLRIQFAAGTLMMISTVWFQYYFEVSWVILGFLRSKLSFGIFRQGNHVPGKSFLKEFCIWALQGLPFQDTDNIVANSQSYGRLWLGHQRKREDILSSFHT